MKRLDLLTWVLFLALPALRPQVHSLHKYLSYDKGGCSASCTVPVKPCPSARMSTILVFSPCSPREADKYAL